MALVQQTGLAPQLALAALQVGMDPAQLVGAAQQQGIPVNEFVAGVFQQQGIPLPPPEGAPFPPSSASSPDGFEGYGPNQDDDDDEASQMMDEVDDLLNDDFDQNDD
jgi:hypothetical protein